MPKTTIFLEKMSETFPMMQNKFGIVSKFRSKRSCSKLRNRKQPVRVERIVVALSSQRGT